MHIVAISGSLRAKSSNTSLVLAAARLAPDGMSVTVFDGLAGLPYFNPDLDGDDPPASVVAFRRLIGSCQGLLICSPEYAGGVSGVLKNALDWLVASQEFAGSPVALINAAPRASSADGHLRVILPTMAARLIEAASIAIPLQGRNLDAAGIVADPILGPQLRGALEAFKTAIEAG